MADPNAALATQVRNIETRTGRSLDQLRALIAASGLQKHGEVRAMLMERLGLGHGDANTLAHAARAEPADAAADPLDTIYTGAKAHLRPLHEQLVERIDAFGPYEKAPKKARACSHYGEARVTRQTGARKARGAAQAGRLGKPCNAAGACLPRSPFGPGYPKALGRVAPLARAASPGRAPRLAQRLGPPRREPSRSVNRPYVSLRRKKQFAMIGPATREQIELGLNARDLPADPRLKALPAGGMCQYSVRLASAAEIDAPLLGWLRSAFDAAG